MELALAKRGPKGIDRDKVLPHIYGEVASGRSLDKVLSEDEGMPGSATFWRWHMDDEEIRENLARARVNGADKHLGEMVPIADDLSEDPASRKVRIYAREKYAQMMSPRKYLPNGGDGGTTINIHVDRPTLAIQAAALLGSVAERTKVLDDD